jgi:hypothetical protein
MPSHTFTRVGLWRNSVDVNRKSMSIALRDGSIAEALHSSGLRRLCLSTNAQLCRGTANPRFAAVARGAVRRQRGYRCGPGVGGRVRAGGDSRRATL